MNLKQKAEKYLSLDPDEEALEITRSKGTYIYNAKGKRYIDFVMGWCVGNFGWDNEAIKRAIRDFYGPTYGIPAISDAPWVKLARLLADITPGKLQKSFRATGGTETAISPYRRRWHIPGAANLSRSKTAITATRLRHAASGPRRNAKTWGIYCPIAKH